MKITSKGRYGLMAMVYLATNYNSERFFKSREIADSQNIPLKYLEHIINSLKKNNLVNSLRGSEGGHRLAKAPDKITVYDILLSLEGNLSIIDGDGSDFFKDNSHSGIFWDNINNQIKTILEIPLSVFIANMLESESGYMYFI